LKIATATFALAAVMSVYANAQQMAGYTNQERMSAFAENAKPVLLECREKREGGQIHGFVAAVKCSNPRIAELWSWYQLGDGDLFALFLAHRMEIAERIDRGTITHGQGLTEVATVMQRLMAQSQERQRSRAQSAQVAAQAQAIAAAQVRAAAAQEQAARSAAVTDALLGAASALGAMSGPSRLPSGAYQLTNNVVTCNRMGTMTTCF